MLEKWTKTSSPCSREMKPKPFSALKNFTVPVATNTQFSTRSTNHFGQLATRERSRPPDAHSSGTQDGARYPGPRCEQHQSGRPPRRRQSKLRNAPIHENSPTRTWRALARERQAQQISRRRLGGEALLRLLLRVLLVALLFERLARFLRVGLLRRFIGNDVSSYARRHR